MAQGDQDFILAVVGNSITSTANWPAPTRIYKVDIGVVPNETINVAIAVTNADVLLGTTGITLVFA